MAGVVITLGFFALVYGLAKLYVENKKEKKKV